MKRPMLLIAVSVILIAVFSFYYNIAALAAAVVALAAITVNMVFFKSRPAALVACLLIVLFCLSCFCCFRRIAQIETLSDKALRINAVAVEDSTAKGRVSTVTLKLLSNRAPYGAKVWVKSYSGKYVKAGDVISVKLNFQSIEEAAYKSYNYSNGIYINAVMNGDFEVVAQNRFYSALQNVRDYISNRLFSSLSYNMAAITNAVLTGEDSYLSENFLVRTKLTGVNHVMVVSGQHLAILVTAIFSFLDRVAYNRFIKFILSTVIVFFITAVCGFSASIIRAAVMYIICAAAPLFGRRSDVLTALAAAIYIILLQNPFAVFSVALQLSASATLGLVLFSGFFCEMLKDCLKPLGLGVLMPLFEMIIVTLSASLMVTPILIYNFGYLAVWAVATNVLITYPITAVLLFSVLAILFGFVPAVASALMRVVEISADFTVRAVDFVMGFGADLIEFEGKAATVLGMVFSVSLIIVLLLVKTACQKRQYLLQLKKM